MCLLKHHTPESRVRGNVVEVCDTGVWFVHLLLPQMRPLLSAIVRPPSPVPRASRLGRRRPGVAHLLVAARRAVEPSAQ